MTPASASSDALSGPFQKPGPFHDGDGDNGAVVALESKEAQSAATAPDASLPLISAR
jgi:hypothetical protein